MAKTVKVDSKEVGLVAGRLGDKQNTHGHSDGPKGADEGVLLCPPPQPDETDEQGRDHGRKQRARQWVRPEVVSRAHTAEHRMGDASGQKGDALDDHEGPDDTATDTRQQPREQGRAQEGLIDQGVDDTVDSDDPAGTTATVTQGTLNDTYDFGFIEPATIGDRVWLDEDGDGVQDAGEAGIANVTVELYADGDTPGTDTPIATTTTDLDGGYLFEDVPAGTYSVFSTPGPETFARRSSSLRSSRSTLCATPLSSRVMARAASMEAACSSACTSASLEPSYVLRALGRNDELAHSSIRFTIGRFTTEEEIDYTIGLVKDKIGKLRELSPLWEMYKDGVDLESVQWAAH